MFLKVTVSLTETSIATVTVGRGFTGEPPSSSVPGNGLATPQVLQESISATIRGAYAEEVLGTSSGSFSRSASQGLAMKAVHMDIRDPSFAFLKR